MQSVGTLYFFCGKMGAGKSTYSGTLAQEKNAVLLSEDEWLTALYPNQINSFDDYLMFSRRMKPLVHDHVQRILKAGTNVVLDFPANTQTQRKWFVELANLISASHKLIFLDRSDARCLRQIAQRRLAIPERQAFDTEEMFNHVSAYFEAPSEEENLNIHTICDGDT
ncbi:AAA family ATPase [Enterovibrio norvegicus]|uniref:AAA family ATPase n=1 Tax=Enterovibrio norvegicus TaxID=188144 RepID=UPI000C82993B|nr:ATP-binding protein [Enterovibrio norvegicus]PML78590.1 cell division protein ZipA [Enterovibrio norvegicus]